MVNLVTLKIGDIVQLKLYVPHTFTTLNTPFANVKPGNLGVVDKILSMYEFSVNNHRGCQPEFWDKVEVWE